MLTEKFLQKQSAEHRTMTSITSLEGNLSLNKLMSLKKSTDNMPKCLQANLNIKKMLSTFEKDIPVLNTLQLEEIKGALHLKKL